MPQIDAPTSPLVPLLKGVHLFHFEGAPCAQRVRFALDEKGLRRGREVPWRSAEPDTLSAEPGTWTSRHVSLIRKDHLTDDYGAIHPHLVVPALVHDGRLWIESMDIVRHLDDAFAGPRLVPTDPEVEREATALVDLGKKLHVSVRYVSFHWGLGRLGKLGAAKEALLRRLERPGSPERLVEFYARYDRDAIEPAIYRAHLDALEEGFGALERRLGADRRPFLLGDHVTIADVIWSPKVLRLHECGYPFARNFPAVFAWHERIAARPAFREGVMGRHRGLSRALRAKAAIENFFGVGLARAARLGAVS